MLREQYAIVSSKLPDVSFVDFQILEIIMFASIVIWVARFVLGLVFLRQYDGFYLMFPNLPPLKIYGALLFSPLGLTLVTAWSIKEQLATAASFFLMDHLPVIYFTFLACCWFSGCWAIAVTVQRVVWIIFRLKWPGAALWCGDQQ